MGEGVGGRKPSFLEVPLTVKEDGSRGVTIYLNPEILDAAEKERLVGITKAKIVPKGFGINVEEEHGVYGFLNVVAHLTIGVDLEANVHVLFRGVLGIDHFGLDRVAFLARDKVESLPFRGHDESQSSTNRGIFIELLQWYGDIDQDVGSIILENSPRNEMMCSPSIQKDIVDACAKETIKAIIEDLDGDFFGILVDESKDISHKEQMTLLLRYLNKEGKVI
ncbi:uncharacterized protein [Nicotiana sylvestris]|uniref:uncharacterized protein n=1 Tax=Nicotiana sylvestris TaxID=4096 RepID=UPI00388C807F